MRKSNSRQPFKSNSRSQPRKPRLSANVILHWEDADKKIYVLIGKSCIVHCKALIENKKNLSPELLRNLILAISNNTFKLTRGGELPGKGFEKFYLGKNFNGILLSGLSLFPGGKLEKGETFQDAAYRELREEFYLNPELIKGGEKVIKDSLEFIFKFGDKRFYSLSLNALGLTPEDIIQEFNEHIKKLGDLSPNIAWHKYENIKDCPPFPEMREIIKVRLDEISIKEAFCAEDIDYFKQEITTFSNFLCDVAKIDDQRKRNVFKEKMLKQMEHHPNGGVHLQAADDFRERLATKQADNLKLARLALKETKEDKNEEEFIGQNPNIFLPHKSWVIPQAIQQARKITDTNSTSEKTDEDKKIVITL